MWRTVLFGRIAVFALVLVSFAAAAGSAAAAAPTNVSLPSIIGTFQEGQVLTATTGGWLGTPTPSYAYQWQRCGAYAARVLSDSPVLFLRLNEASGTTAVDSSSTAGNGTYTEGFTLGQTGGLACDGATATAFNGTSGYVTVPDSNPLHVSDVFSVEFWMSRSAPASAGYPVHKALGTAGFRVYSGSDGALMLLSGGGATVAPAGTVPFDGSWHHYVLVKNGPNGTIYKDGQVVVSGGGLTAATSSTVPLAVAAFSGGAPGGFFKGTLEEVALYSSALSATRVQVHSEAGIWADVSGGDSSGYGLGSSDVGANVRVKVTATNVDGSASAVSLAGLVQGAAISNISPPTVSGLAQQGQTLTATTGSWSGAAPISYGYQWQRCPSQYRDAVLVDQPAAYWRLGEGAGATKAIDVAHGLNGDYNGSPTRGQSGSGALPTDADTSVLFHGTSGSNDFVSVADAPELDLGDRFTLEAWIKPGSLGAYRTIISKGTNGYALRLDPSGKPFLSKENVVDLAYATQPVDANSWSHVVATKSGDTVKLYVNGLDVTPASTNVATIAPTTAQLTIGRYSGAVEWFEGSIDEVAIYATALSLNQVKNHFDAGIATSQPACASISGATASTLTLGAADVDKQLRVRVTASNSGGSATADSLSTRIVEDGGPVNTASPLIGTSATPTAPGGTLHVGDAMTVSAPGTWSGATPSYAYQWQTCDGYGKQVLQDGAIGYWRLGESSGTIAVNSAGGSNGEYIGPPTLRQPGTLAGDPDTAADFDGANSYVSLSGTFPTDSSPTNRSHASIEVWAKAAGPDTASTDQTLAGWGGAGTNQAFFLALNRAANAVYPRIRLGGTAWVDTTLEQAKLAQDRWNHIVIVDDGNNLKFFVNGAAAGSSPNNQLMKQNAVAQIGRYLQAQSGSSHFNGYLDEVAFYNTALTPQQVQTHYNLSFAYPTCTDIAGQATANYTLGSADGGKQVRVRITGTNAYGTGYGYSDVSPLITGGGPRNTALPTINGSSYAGQSLGSTTGSWAGIAPISYTRQWQRCTDYGTQLLAPANPPTTGEPPIGYWRLNDVSGDTAADLAVLGNGSYVGAGVSAKGAVNDSDAAVALSGGGYVALSGSFPADPDPPAARKPATVEAWVKSDNYKNNSAIVGWGDKGTADHGFYLGVSVDGNGNAHPAFFTYATTGPAVVSNVNLLPGVWYHLALVDSGTSIKLYVNGVEKLTSPIGALKRSDYARIGAFGPEYLSGQPFAGVIDEVAVYDRGVSAAELLNHATTLATAAPTCGNISGATGSTYSLVSPADVTSVVRLQVTANNASGSSVATSLSSAPVTEAPASLDTPKAGGGVHTDQPTLTMATVTGASYAFQIASDTNFTKVLDSSGWRASTNTYTVPTAGKLKDGQSYWWRGRTKTTTGSSAWSAPRSFKVSIERLGVRDFWPIWKRGPLAVNEANGNLVLSLPGPSYPTAVGSTGVALTYNSQGTKDEGLGVGWTLSGGDLDLSPPTKLIDHGLIIGDIDVAELVWPDGSSAFYSHVAESNIYLSTPGDTTSVLKKNDDAEGTWTLTEADGTIYSFGGANAQTYEATLTSVESSAAVAGTGKLTYEFQFVTTNPPKPRLTKITDPAGRTLTLNWNDPNPSSDTQLCPSNTIVCVTGPDGVKWSYRAGNNFRLTAVYRGIAQGPVTQVLALGYGDNGKVNKIQNANDLNPSQAGTVYGEPYNAQHAITFTYDSESKPRVTSITEGPITTPTATMSPKWTFSYTGPVSLAVSNPQNTHASIPSGRIAVGYTTVIPPRQQGQQPAKGATVYYDELDHPIENVSILDVHTLAEYNDRNQLLWTEGAEHEPTDYSWETTRDVLTYVDGPDPDGPGPLGRPRTRYGYDEQLLSSSGTLPKITGLQAAYYSNGDLAGRPTVIGTDPNVDFNWGSSAPAGLSDNKNFSARWTGSILGSPNCDMIFSTLADDGVSLVIDGIALIDTWDEHTSRATTSKPIQLASGPHKIVLEYYHHAPPNDLEPAEMHLRFTYTACRGAFTTNTQTVPSSWLVPDWLNQTTVTSPSGRVAFSHFARPETGLPDYTLARLADGTNVITSLSYDSYGRPTKKVMPKGNATRTIDAQGDLQGSVDNTYATTYSYYGLSDNLSPPDPCGGGPANQAGLPKSTTPHGIATTTTVYDSSGRPVAVTNGRGTNCMTYTTGGLLASEIAPGETLGTRYTYDPAGALRTVTDNSGALTVTTEYDEAGRITDTVDSFTAEARFTYDLDGNQIERVAAPGPLVSSANYTTTYVYNDAGALTSLLDPTRVRTYSFFYCSCGKLKAIQYPNGTFSWNDYDSGGNLTAVYNRHGTLGGSLPSTVPSDANPIVDYSYDYDIDGQKKQEVRSGDGLTTETTSYHYDDLGRLSQVVLPGSLVRNYTFDLDSNRTSIIENGTTVSSYSYDIAVTAGVDQLTSVSTGGTTTNYRYTADGQVKTRGVDTLTWDNRGRHSGGTFGGSTIGYGFDPTGFRRQRTSDAVTTRYLLGGLFETNGSGTLSTTAVDSPAGDVAHYAGAPSTTNVTFNYYNGHGDLAAVVDYSGSKSAYTYDPFGGLRSGTAPSNVTSERWVGRHDKKLDTGSALIEMGVRTYEPSIGRFLSVDPVDGGSFNEYDYAFQDPINVFDLSGSLPPQGYFVGKVNNPHFSTHAYLRGLYRFTVTATWFQLSGQPVEARLTLRLQWQTSSGGWLNLGAPGIATGRSGTRVIASARCRPGQVLTLRAVLDIDIIGKADDARKDYSRIVTVKCGR